MKYYASILLCLWAVGGCLAPSTPHSIAPQQTSIPGCSEPAVPFHIQKPGVYQLTGHRICAQTGIVIHCANVTLDLGGYTLKGPGKNSGKNYGILTNNFKNITVRNGTIRDFGDRGLVDRGEKRPTGYKRVINVQFLNNGGCGICIGGPANLVQNCICAENGVTGICPGYRSHILNNLCHRNQSNGIHPGRGSIVKGNTVSENGRCGIEAYCGSLIVDNCVYMNNTSDDPNAAGIQVMHGSSVLNNTLRDNRENNLRLMGIGNRIVGNTITGSRFPATGIKALATDNDCKDNTFQGNREDHVGLPSSP